MSDLPPRRLLVIDDDPSTAEVVRGWYAMSNDMVVDSAPDGQAGLDAIAKRTPDLVLLDLCMPGVDGIEVSRRLKGDVATRAIPIVLLTAMRDIDHKVRAFEAGVDDYVTKPFEFAEVDARIRTLLATRRRMEKLESTVLTLQSTNSELEELLIVDEKTGLYNFRHFQRKLRDEWSRHERYGTPLSLVLFDLDDFKQLNDTAGHPAGDLALREFATLVLGGARSTDIAARYGGEEFAVILPHTDGPMAQRVAERIRSAVESFTFIEDESPRPMTVSAGIATVPDSSIDSMDDLIRAADRALYRAKDQGKNRVVADESSALSIDTLADDDSERSAELRRRRASGRRRSRLSPDARARRH
ncbi:MAG: diguanylate cyclase [Planctomycetota bacterium]|nr:diguanylate cyclase [Planctomycetota bacterium]